MPAGLLYQEYIVNYTLNVRDIQQNRMYIADFLNPRDAVVPMPPIIPVRRMRYINPAVGARPLATQREFDAAMWYGACQGTAGPTLLRIFQLLKCAGVLYKTGLNWVDWRASGHPIATLLSHGGRVLIQTRGFVQTHNRFKSDVMTDPVWTWLNQPGHIRVRGYATHGVATRDGDAAARGHILRFKEKGGGAVGAFQSVKGHAYGRHFSFNVGLGGPGNFNPVSRATQIDPTAAMPQDRIKATAIGEAGVDGHVYIYYRPPTQGHAYGALLVGCENAEHGAGVNPHTACGHGLGGAQPVSACGGLKFKTWPGAQGPTKSYTGLFCNVVPHSASQAALGGWLNNVANVFDPNDLDQSPNRVPHVNPPMPT